MMVPERLAIPRSSLRSGRKKRTVVKFRESAIPTSDRYVDGMNDSIKWHLLSVREQVHKAVEQLRDLLGLSSNNIRSHNRTDKKNKAAQDAEVAIDESQIINDAKDDAKSIVSDLANRVPPMNVTESFKSLFGKKEEPVDKSTEEENKEGSEQ